MPCKDPDERRLKKSLKTAREIIQNPVWRWFLETKSGLKGKDLFIALEQAIAFGWIEYIPPKFVKEVLKDEV